MDNCSLNYVTYDFIYDDVLSYIHRKYYNTVTIYNIIKKLDVKYKAIQKKTSFLDEILPYIDKNTNNLSLYQNQEKIDVNLFKCIQVKYDVECYVYFVEITNSTLLWYTKLSKWMIYNHIMPNIEYSLDYSLDKPSAMVYQKRFGYIDDTLYWYSTQYIGPTLHEFLDMYTENEEVLFEMCKSIDIVLDIWNRLGIVHNSFTIDNVRIKKLDYTYKYTYEDIYVRTRYIPIPINYSQMCIVKDSDIYKAVEPSKYKIVTKKDSNYIDYSTFYLSLLNYLGKTDSYVKTKEYLYFSFYLPLCLINTKFNFGLFDTVNPKLFSDIMIPVNTESNSDISLSMFESSFTKSDIKATYNLLRRQTQSGPMSKMKKFAIALAWITGTVFGSLSVIGGLTETFNSFMKNAASGWNDITSFPTIFSSFIFGSYEDIYNNKLNKLGKLSNRDNIYSQIKHILSIFTSLHNDINKEQHTRTIYYNSLLTIWSNTYKDIFKSTKINPQYTNDNMSIYMNGLKSCSDNIKDKSKYIFIYEFTFRDNKSILTSINLPHLYRHSTHTLYIYVPDKYDDNYDGDNSDITDNLHEIENICINIYIFYEKDLSVITKENEEEENRLRAEQIRKKEEEKNEEKCLQYERIQLLYVNAVSIAVLNTFSKDTSEFNENYIIPYNIDIIVKFIQNTFHIYPNSLYMQIKLILIEHNKILITNDISITTYKKYNYKNDTKYRDYETEQLDRINHVNTELNNVGIDIKFHLKESVKKCIDNHIDNCTIVTENVPIIPVSPDACDYNNTIKHIIDNYKDNHIYPANSDYYEKNKKIITQYIGIWDLLSVQNDSYGYSTFLRRVDNDIKIVDCIDETNKMIYGFLYIQYFKTIPNIGNIIFKTDNTGFDKYTTIRLLFLHFIISLNTDISYEFTDKIKECFFNLYIEEIEEESEEESDENINMNMYDDNMSDSIDIDSIKNDNKKIISIINKISTNDVSKTIPNLTTKYQQDNIFTIEYIREYDTIFQKEDYELYIL